MIAWFEATCGITWNGQGQFSASYGCRLEVTAHGLKASLSNLVNLWARWYSVGLFQNDYAPKLNDTIASLQEANFSGYSGRQLIDGFSTPGLVGVIVQTVADELQWRHNGGAIGNDIYGYFVVDNKGKLAWAERFCTGPIKMATAGRVLRLTPTFFVKNWREENSV